jgi:hypothetical protein
MLCEPGFQHKVDAVLILEHLKQLPYYYFIKIENESNNLH